MLREFQLALTLSTRRILMNTFPKKKVKHEPLQGAQPQLSSNHYVYIEIELNFKGTS